MFKGLFKGLFTVRDFPRDFPMFFFFGMLRDFNGCFNKTIEAMTQ